MCLKTLALVTLYAFAVYAATNEPCYGRNSSPGLCVSTTTCKEAGGKSHTGACIGNARGSGADPGNIQCCVKSTCTDNGACLWESHCGGETTSSQCPGPGTFKCCSKRKGVFGTYKTPSVPTSNCAALSEKGAKAVMKEFPGRTRVMYCYAGDDPSSDHYTGMAIDFMISDAGGVSFTYVRLSTLFLEVSLGKRRDLSVRL
ncbi:hypothetical protein M409DRAFT_18894 [Zasmidium cellare ATCC 36951]|uniref:ARB-07466-like C-terminal domain-containing protein n=1 Tax=Zasmidium cellare ATCC 36951 TaxID=1080233 RepID=A0A6A6CW40_ZASCE|nr:uncharacterized protein M409DRAFT_18894 [Zasmidium cellare ATCC 36951]KAF2170923.1 hypothetical protein M409DRAFT_18894 [Zasmidium cellare ATCC 36951]